MDPKYSVIKGLPCTFVCVKYRFFEKSHVNTLYLYIYKRYVSFEENLYLPILLLLVHYHNILIDRND